MEIKSVKNYLVNVWDIKSLQILKEDLLAGWEIKSSINALGCSEREHRLRFYVCLEKKTLKEKQGRNNLNDKIF